MLKSLPNISDFKKCILYGNMLTKGTASESLFCHFSSKRSKFIRQILSFGFLLYNWCSFAINMMTKQTSTLFERYLIFAQKLALLREPM